MKDGYPPIWCGSCLSMIREDEVCKHMLPAHAGDKAWGWNNAR